MVPPAISVIHCHLRWRDGSLWHWPLTHPTFFSEWRIMLIGPPLSATRMCLGDGDRRTDGPPPLEEGIYTVFCRPLEAGDLSAPALAPRISLWETSSSPRPPLFHSTCPDQNRRYMWPREPFLRRPGFLGTRSIWLCGPSLQGWLNSGVCLFHSTSSR